MLEIQQLSDFDHLLLDCWDSTAPHLLRDLDPRDEKLKREKFLVAYETFLNQRKQECEVKIYSSMLQLEQDALYTSQRLNTEWQQLRKSEQYEGIRKKLLQNMHRAVRLSMEDGARMIEHYGHDGVYKKVSVGGNLVNGDSMNKTKVR